VPAAAVPAKMLQATAAPTEKVLNNTGEIATSDNSTVITSDNSTVVTGDNFTST
jgi:hypothetical protein